MTNSSPHMPFLTRFAFMAVGWGSIGTVYTLSGLRDVSQAHVLDPSPVDLWFTFNPGAIWVYMSFFAFVPLGYFCTPPQQVKWLCAAMMISAGCAAVVFNLFPTTMTFPPVTQDGISAEALKLLMRYDALVNCLPSLHVTLTTLALFALWDNARMGRNLLLTTWAVAISVSILPLYRHQFVDLLAGLALAVFAALLVTGLQRTRLRRLATS